MLQIPDLGNDVLDHAPHDDAAGRGMDDRVGDRSSEVYGRRARIDPEALVVVGEVQSEVVAIGVAREPVCTLTGAVTSMAGLVIESVTSVVWVVSSSVVVL